VDNQEYFNVVCDPIEAKRRPTTTVEAQFSMPYTVAVALLNGTITLADFEPAAIRQADRAALALRVEPDLGDPHFTGRMLPTPSRVEVVLTDGTVIEGRRNEAPGHPRDPLSWEQLEVKVRQMVEWPDNPLPRDNADRLIAACKDLENSADIRGLVADHLSWLS
jgi:2-methylcitrate dehydratase PrpD